MRVKDIPIEQSVAEVNAEYHHIHRIFQTREAMLEFTSRCTKRRYLGRKKATWYPACRMK